MFQTTRRRLALWYTTVTAILLLLFATGVYLYVRSTLIERVDDTLNHVVEVVQRSLVIEPVNIHSEGGLLRVNVETSFRDNTAPTEDDRIDIEWFSPTGDLLWSTFAEPLDLPLHFNPNGETVKAGGSRQEAGGTPEPSGNRAIAAQSPALSSPLILRQITQRIETNRQVLGYLRVSHPWFEVTKPSREFFFDLALGIGLMVAAVGAIGWFLSGLAMRPVDEAYQRLKQFTADASHELRSPIAVIQTNVQVALADPNPTPQAQAHHLQVVERLTRRLGRLVDDLLFLARQDSGMVQSRRSELALDALLKEIIEEQQTIATEKHIEIGLQLIPPPSPPLLSASPSPTAWTHLQGDRDQLSRLFTNLISNAVQYTPPRGSVSLNIQQVGRSGNPFLQICVCDTGIGISPEALPQVFERFYRVDPSRSQTAAAGSGLGLAIAQAIVHNHHGQIQIDSTPNNGTTVTITLPQREEN
jgi:two-component system, OmpR family, manganese sensing sensor histidine kinase